MKNLQEVLRVEQLLLQIEQQELKRQREKLIMHKNLARRELDEGVKMLLTNNIASSSLQDLNASTIMTNGSIAAPAYDANVQYRHVHNHPPIRNEYRKSMPNLQDFNGGMWNQEVTASYSNQQQLHQQQQQHYGNMGETSRSEMHLHAPQPYHHHHHQHQHQHQQQQQQQVVNNNNNNNNVNSSNNIYGNMTRHALMQISAVPKPKLTNDWVQYRKSEPAKSATLNSSHWLIQEAEQRRIEQLNNIRQKPLPESIIQTITQRVVNLGIGTNVNKR
jgi:F-box protein 20